MFLNQKFSESVKGLIKVKSVKISRPVFNLHCKITTLMLLFACVIVSLKQYVAEDGPIQCIVDGFKNSDMKKEHTKVVQTFCWIHSTFTMIPKNTTDGDNKLEEEPEYRKIYHYYYQWVSVVFFLQAMAFYLPMWLWKLSEGKLMAHLKGVDVEELRGRDDLATWKNNLVDYFTYRLKFQGHRTYAATYWFCEFLCLVNTISQVFAVDKFLNGNFLLYGLRAFDLMTFDPRYPSDGIFTFPGMTNMDFIFPMQTKCAFYRYGNSGNVYMQDALCVLVLNSYNRYIFLVMWFWFLLLSILITFVLFNRVACIFVPQLRYIYLKTGKNNSEGETNFVVRNLSVFDWWVLYSLKCNISKILFKDVVLELSRKVRTNKSNTD